ncbi:MAG: ABC transporter ATP-binding protein [Propionicimonas sp.]
MTVAGVKAATPSWVLRCSIGLAWAAAVATALLFWRLGTALDAGLLTAAELTGMLALAVTAALLAAGGAWFAQWAPSEAERALRRLVIGRVFDLGVTGTHDRGGELLSLATIGVEKTATYRAGFLGPIVGALTTPFLVLAVMAFTVDATVAGWLALLVLLVPVLLGGFQQLVRPIGAAYRRTQLALSRAFLEAVQAIDTLVYARAAGRMGARLAERGEQHRRGVMRLLAGNQVLIFVVDAAFSLTVVVAAGLLVTGRITAGTLSLGQGVAILLMTTLVVGPVDVIGQFFYIGIAGRASQRELGDLLDAQEPTGPAAVPPPEAAGTIVLDGVTAGWPDGPDVLTGVSLRVGPGERVALIGPSGVGKSTLAALVQGHLLPRAGRVWVDGQDVIADPAGARTRLAVVEQRTFLFLGSIADNLLVAAPDADETRLWEALELAGLRDEVEAMPDGLATQVGEHGRLLSGGQAQRLAIARAALRDAPVLLLDEPTSQVDLAGEAAILAALDRLARGRTVLLIAHRPGAVLAADRVVELAAENGPPGTVPAVSPAKGSADKLGPQEPSPVAQESPGGGTR